MEITKGKKGIEFQCRLQDDVCTLLCNQLDNEIISAHIYKMMSFWLDDCGYVRMAELFYKYGKEEMEHSDKIVEYLFSRNCKPCIETIPKQVDSFGSIRDLIEKSLEHEIAITANWDAIANKAKEFGDNTTYDEALWFLNEQLEEEEKFRNVLYYLNQGGTEWYLENNLEEIFK